MACSKYILVNTGSTIVTFNYQRCDDALWMYQEELNPGQTKNIWLLNNTYSSAFSQYIVLTNLGTFPSLTPTPTPSVSASPAPTNTQTPTNTPTPSVTASETPTMTQTATETPTQTPTMTQTATETPTQTPTQTPSSTPVRFEFNVGSGSTENEACSSGVVGSIWGDNQVFSDSNQFYPESTGPSTMLAGYYSYNGEVVDIDSSGSSGAFTLCIVVPTPTQTPTLTNTPTQTQTPTLTNTQTPTPTRSVWDYSLGYDVSIVNNACSDYTSSPSTYYSSLGSGPGPNVGETLFTNVALTNPAPNGFYSNGTGWYEITGGAGLITSSDPNGCGSLPTQTPTLTQTMTQTPTNTPTLTQTMTPTPSPTPYRNMFFSNNSSGSQITGFTGSFTSLLNFSFPVTIGMNAQAFHGPITDSVDTIEVYVTGGTNVSVWISKNGGVLSQDYGTAPFTSQYTFGTNLTENDELAIYLYDGAVTNSLGYDVASSATACTNFTSSPSNYYSSVTLATGVNIFTDTSLTTLAPDGYYSDGTNYYQVSGGSNLGPVAC